VAMNPNRRKLAEALAFPKNESSISPENLWRSSEAPNPAAEPESKKYDIICPKKYI
jgi:hypothetical protein